ncbi:MAG: hypothetical protein FJ265_14090, partial [Planctomycetes bacterium]|nr:hypothetical protein [Planctomycetota bacterium]
MRTARTCAAVRRREGMGRESTWAQGSPTPLPRCSFRRRLPRARRPRPRPYRALATHHAPASRLRMRVIECDSQDQAAELVAAEILAALARKPDLVLGLATGSTPIGVYERLVAAHRAGRADFTRVRTFNLDEYIGLPAAHEQSYRTFMKRHLFDAIGIRPGQVHFPPVEGNDLAAACAAYEQTIKNTGGIDIQLLGVGSNGHP